MLVESADARQELILEVGRPQTRLAGLLALTKNRRDHREERASIKRLLGRWRFGDAFQVRRFRGMIGAIWLQRRRGRSRGQGNGPRRRLVSGWRGRSGRRARGCSGAT